VSRKFYKALIIDEGGDILYTRFASAPVDKRDIFTALPMTITWLATFHGVHQTWNFLKKITKN
jgi:hypothetical protein